MNLLGIKLDFYQQTDSLGIQKWMDFENTKTVGMYTLYSTRGHTGLYICMKHYSWLLDM